MTTYNINNYKEILFNNQSQSPEIERKWTQVDTGNVWSTNLELISTSRFLFYLPSPSCLDTPQYLEGFSVPESLLTAEILSLRWQKHLSNCSEGKFTMNLILLMII